MATEILRPNAAGDETNIEFVAGASYHWEAVDEEVADDSASRVGTYSTNNWLRDLYNLPAHSAGSGTINFIKVYARGRNNATGNQNNLKIAIKTGGTTYESSEIAFTTTWTDYSNQWDTNPETSAAWTWDDIDALQIGVNIRRARSDSGSFEAACTQVYVEVDYTAAITVKESSDTGAGVDAKASDNPIATLVKAETGSGSDILSQAQAILDASETGSGVDAVASLQTPQAKTSSDAGSGTEGTPVPSATLSGSEGGSGIEAIIARLLAALDTGSGVEASLEVGGQPKSLSAGELGQGDDGLVAKIEIPAKGGGMKLWT